MKKLLTLFVLLITCLNAQAQQSDALLSNGGNDNDYWETELFGAGLNNEVNAITIRNDDIFVGGWFTEAGGQPANKVARFNTVTETWHTLGSGVNGLVKALAVIGDNVFVGGDFPEAGGQLANSIARFNTVTETWHTLGSGVNGRVNTLEVEGTDLYVGGFMWNAGGQQVYNIAVFNTITDTWHSTDTLSVLWPINVRPVFEVEALLPPVGDIFPPPPFFVGGSGAVYTDQYDCYSLWCTIIEDTFYGTGGGVSAFAYYDWRGPNPHSFYNVEVFVGMYQFTYPYQHIPLRRYSMFGVGGYTGGWTEDLYNFEDRIEGDTHALKINGGNLYMGGLFNWVDGTEGSPGGIFRYNIETDTFYNLGSGINGWVNALEHQGGYVYAVGSFNNAGGKPASGIARWAGPEVLNDRHTATVSGPNEGWRLLGSPVASTTYSEFLSNIWTQGYHGSNYPEGAPNVFVYSQWSGGWHVPINEMQIVGSFASPSVDPFLYGRPYSGVAVYVFDDDNYDGTPNPWPKTIEVQGIPNHRTFTMSLQKTNNNGWYLLSNPFPFPLSWSSIAEGLDPAHIHSNLYVWDANRAGGADYVDSASEEFSGIIEPFQGFWVRSLSQNSGVLTIGPEHQATGEEEPGVLLSTEHIPTLRLSVSGSGKHTQTELYFDDERALYPESFNAYRMSSLELEYLHLFTTSPGNTDAWRAQYLPLTQTFVKEVPLFIHTTSAGEFTLQVSEFPEIHGMEIYLTDHATNEQILLSEGFSHTFILDQASTKTIDTRSFESRFAEMKPAISVNEKNSENRFTLTVALTATNIDVETELPKTTHLEQNYPNPFNPTTQIRYDLSESANVRLEVYNMMGQRVATLVNAHQNAGTHTVSFDAANLASGVYIYRLTAGSFVQTRKMMLVK